MVAEEAARGSVLGVLRYPGGEAISTNRERVNHQEVKITRTGSRAGDNRAANEAAGFSKTPEGFTWHHHQDGTTMQLVPKDIHAQTGHTGGFSR